MDAHKLMGELVRLRQQETEIKAELALVRGKIRHAQLLLGEREGDEEPSPIASIGTISFMRAIRNAANRAMAPLTKPELKSLLRSQGWSSEKIEGAYLYVAISKLKKRGRISELPGGRIWKA